MVALPLFDAVIAQKEPQQSAHVAAQIVQSALSEIKSIEKLDQSLVPQDPKRFDRETIALLRETYEQWARGADALLERVSRIEAVSGRVPDSELLRQAHGRTRAMLSIPLDRLERAHYDIVQGRTKSAAEVRRELRLGVR